MVPKLNNLSYDKNASIPLDQIFEASQETWTQHAHSKTGTKVKRKNIETVRHDVLHEENLNILVETA
jgi:hypothetical protein